VIVDPDINSELMTDEIFGPVLPILAVNDVEEALQFMYVITVINFTQIFASNFIVH